MANATVSKLTRSGKFDVGKQLLARLVARKNKGPNEEPLDAFIPLLTGVNARLETHVEGKVVTNAARKALLVKLELADCNVDTWLRHHESYVFVEAHRAVGPNVEAAKALHEAAFPEGLSHVDDYIPEENQSCRAAIAVLRSNEHAPTVEAIRLPKEWTNEWEAALGDSDATFVAVNAARESKSGHVDEGLDAEDDFVDIVVRLRRYIASRASRKDTAKQAEGRELLQPLTEALKKMAVEQASRETRKKTDSGAATP